MGAMVLVDTMARGLLMLSLRPRPMPIPTTMVDMDMVLDTMAMDMVLDTVPMDMAVDMAMDMAMAITDKFPQPYFPTNSKKTTGSYIKNIPRLINHQMAFINLSSIYTSAACFSAASLVPLGMASRKC